MDDITNNKLTRNADRHYSMHTMTISSHLTYLEKDILKECLENYTQQNGLQRYDGTEDGYKNKIIWYRGIANEFGFNEVKLISCIPRNTEIKNYWLKIKINPRRLFHYEDYPYVYIASYDDVTKCMKRVKAMLKVIGAPKMMIKIFKLQRIDFCVNINLGSADKVKEYMSLLLKGAYSKHFMRRMEYSSSHKRNIPTKDSFTINSPNIEFALYDKHKQLSKESFKYSLDEIQEAEGIIRIELRIKRPIIYQKNKKYHIDTIQEFLKYTNEIASQSIPRYIKMAYGTGKFVTFDRAKKIIRNSRYKTKTKSELINMLELVSEKRSLQDAKYEMPDKLYKKCINKFNELELSPITVPRRFDIREYQNPLYYIKNCNCNF